MVSNMVTELLSTMSNDLAGEDIKNIILWNYSDAYVLRREQ